jgi:iron complex transport system substrate-binding protein
VKIVSLVPSATEIVFALGLDNALAAVSHDCDFPEAARSKPAVSGTALPAAESLTPGEIDAAVVERMDAEEPLYTLDRALIAEIQPDLILAQDLCRVCAVPSGAVDDALDVIGCRADVVSLDPSTLDDVIATIGEVGAATGTTARADVLMRSLRERIEAVRRAVAGRPPPRVLALEWPDPPFSGGHWVPDMIECAGGEPVLARAGEPSRRVGWDEIEAARADVAVFMPCGYDLAGAVELGRALLDVDALAGVERLYAANANGLFSRPGPRVVDGVEALAWVLHPDAVPPPPAGALTRLA